MDKLKGTKSGKTTSSTASVSLIMKMDKLKGKKSGKTTSYTAKFLASTTKETRFARSTTLLMSEKASIINKPRALGKDVVKKY